MARPSLIDAVRPRHFPNTPYRVQPGPGRPKGSRNVLQCEAKWIINEAVRLNGGLEWVAKWAKRNPNLFIPAWMRAMVPKPFFDESALDENHVTIIIQRFSDPALVPLPVPLPDT